MKKEKNRFEVKKATGLTFGKIIVDTETGVNYLYYFSGIRGELMGGGLTPLLNADGSVVVTKE
ncbi:MAG: xylan 1,4-beta-xylosidase [Clostridia bacterium]|nr:xylan 1,4-beta-xylosidase [Clostridia bacterium]